MPEDLTGYKYKGQDFITLVEVENEIGEKSLKRFFDQTGGSVSIENDELDISTKDRTGSDYGDKTETKSLEGELVYGDDAVDFIKNAARKQKFVKIYDVNVKTLKAEYGMYMISSFEREYDHGDFATYSLEGTLYGEICETELTEITEGAPSLPGMDCDGGENDGGDGGVEG